MNSEDLEKVRKDPAVQKTMSLFGGELIDVRRDAPETGDEETG
jgi:hypothetical protein